VNDVMSKAEVASILDCEPDTVEEKARTGELPAVKFGRSWIFPRTALLECLHKQALENTKPKASAAPKAIAKKTARRAPPALPAL
jgi:excisionase family DNA binding protein